MCVCLREAGAENRNDAFTVEEEEEADLDFLLLPVGPSALPAMTALDHIGHGGWVSHRNWLGCLVGW